MGDGERSDNLSKLPGAFARLGRNRLPYGVERGRERLPPYPIGLHQYANNLCRIEIVSNWALESIVPSFLISRSLSTVLI